MRILILLMLSLPGIAFTQTYLSSETSSPAISSSMTEQDSAGVSAQQTSPTTPHHKLFRSPDFFGKSMARPSHPPVGSFTAGYIYTFTDSQTGHNRSLMGWSAVPEVELYKNIGLQAEFSGLYVRSIYPGENGFIAAAGPRYTFAPRSRLTPFVYAEGGQMRSTGQANHNSDWNTVVKGGFGFEHEIKGGIAFQLIPGEYVGEQLDDHSWENSFSARAGITFKLYR